MSPSRSSLAPSWPRRWYRRSIRPQLVAHSDSCQSGQAKHGRAGRDQGTTWVPARRRRVTARPRRPAPPVRWGRRRCALVAPTTSHEPGAAAAFGSPQPPATEPARGGGIRISPTASHRTRRGGGIGISPSARRLRPAPQARSGRRRQPGPLRPSPGAPGDPCDHSQPARVWAMSAHCRPSRPDRPAATHPQPASGTDPGCCSFDSVIFTPS